MLATEKEEAMESKKSGIKSFHKTKINANNVREIVRILGLGQISGLDGYLAIFNIRLDTGY